MIEAHEISRSYGTLKAVDRVSFAIGRREIVGLLGHNGAGKTTIMKMLTGFLEPSSGQIAIDDLELVSRRREVQRRIGYLPENCPLYPDLSVLEHLEHHAALHGIPSRHRADAIRRAVERTELGSKAMAQVATLSRGYRQRLGVAQAILHEPPILILDEPTNGLDPSQIQHMRALIRELARQATVIISTHILQEVEAVCSRVLIMRGGRLALDSRLDAIGTTPRLLVTLDRPLPEVTATLSALDPVRQVTHLGDAGSRRRFALETEDAAQLAPLVAQTAAASGWALYELTPERRDLEALFSALSSGAAEAETAVQTDDRLQAGTEQDAQTAPETQSGTQSGTDTAIGTDPNRASKTKKTTKKATGARTPRRPGAGSKQKASARKVSQRSQRDLKASGDAAESEDRQTPDDRSSDSDAEGSNHG